MFQGKTGDDFDKEKIFKPDYEFENQLELEEVVPNGGNVLYFHWIHCIVLDIRFLFSSWNC